MLSDSIVLFAAPPELIIVLILLLLLFGTSRLPKLGHALGKAIPAWEEGRSNAPAGDTSEGEE